jgi:hypothetical protein
VLCLFVGEGPWSGEERRFHRVQLLQTTCGDLGGEDRVVHLAGALKTSEVHRVVHLERLNSPSIEVLA